MEEKIISIILKSIVSGKSVNELLGQIEDVIMDKISAKGMENLRDFVSKSRNKLNRVLTKETLVKLNVPQNNTDYVITEVTDILSHITIDNEVFKNCHYDDKELRDYIWNSYKIKHVTIEMESDVKKGINAVTVMLMDLFRKSERFTETLLTEIYWGVDTANSKLDAVDQKIQVMSEKADKNAQIIYEAIITSLGAKNNSGIMLGKIPYNKASEYLDLWDENMFLNKFDDRDETAGPTVKLSDVYMDEHLPHYIWRDNTKPSTDLKELLSEHIVDKTENKMLLVLGQPGIGKSTLITWIMAKFENQRDEIFVYRCSSDLQNIDWQKNDVYTDILERLNLSYDSLYGKTLILDGLDEISAVNNRKNILNSLYRNIIKSNVVKRFSVIITCRENYIEQYKDIQCAYITLQPWDEFQIRNFCKVFGKITMTVIDEKTIENINKKADILGIPLILYMVLSLNIKVESTYSMVDIYDKVFSLEGGIYDRCINHKEYAGSHRIKKIKKYIHIISKEIAIWIFENNPDEEIISQKEYETICDHVVSDQEQQDVSIKQDVLIGNFFERIKESEDEETGIDGLHFIHRSIYEYFVVEAIFCSIKNILVNQLDEEQEIFIKNLIKYFKIGRISNTIGEFLKYKILKLYNSMDYDKKKSFWKWMETAVGKMMERGMVYFIEMDIKRLDCVIVYEAICFYNVMFLLSELSETYFYGEYLLSNVRGKLKQFYLLLFVMADQILKMYHIDNFHGLVMRKIDFLGCNFSGMTLKYSKFSCSNFRELKMRAVVLAESNLSSADLSGADLSSADLNGAELRDANLSGADLSGADLKDAELRYAELRYANLSGADLRDADLRDADLRDADLRDADLRDADLRGTDLRGADLSSTNLSYTLLEDTNLESAFLDDSLWSTENISLVFLNLQEAIFDSIRIQLQREGDIAIKTREDLFL